MNVEVIPSIVTAAPGEQVQCQLRIESTEPEMVSYALQVVGFDATDVRASPARGQLPAGGVAEIDVLFSIPDAFAAGHHAVAVEVVPDGDEARTLVAPLTVEVGTIEPVAVAVVPSMLRGRRRARFHVNIDNRAAVPIAVELTGEAPDVDIRLTPARLELRPGARVQIKGRAKARRHLAGRPLQHPLSVVARSHSAPRYAPATFHQRPLFPNSLRTASVIMLVVAVWAAALGGAFFWWNQLNDDEEQVTEAALVDTDGDGIPDTPGDELMDTDGDGVPDTPAAEVAEQVAAGGDDSGDDDGATAPTSVVVGGTVAAGENGENSDVAVTLTPLDLDESPVAGDAAQLGGTVQAGFAPFSGPAGQSAPVAGRVSAGEPTSPGEGSPVKLWPDRFGRYESPDRPPVRQTVSVQSTATRDEGAWLFSDVPIGQHYEVHFAKPGFDSKSFIVSPPADGEPIELDVELQPANGAISGVVRGPGGAGLGNVDIEVTDGTLTFTTSTGTDEDEPGAWSLAGISTPGTYTLTATLDGYGTEVAQVELEAGERQDDIDLEMMPGVGSITGRISSRGEPLGGVSITASDGEEIHTTTSLTEGDTGTFSFPRLGIPAEYTLTVEAEGYITETRLVDLEGNTTGVNIAMSSTTATITGMVTSRRDGPLPGVNIEAEGEDLEFHTDSAVAPDAGAFSMSEVPPGTYRIEFSRFDHRSVSRLVTVEAGEVADLGEIELPFGRQATVEQDGSLTVRVVDSSDTDLTGATVRVRDAGTQDVVATLPDPDRPGSGDDQATFVFEPLDVGTYIVEAERPPLYRRATRRVSVGLGEESVTIPLFQLGQASGRLVDSLTGDELDDYEVTIMRINADDTATEVQRIVVPPGAPADAGPDNDQIRWETEANSLTTGIYRVDVTDPPPGYRVEPDQNLFGSARPMHFRLAPEREDPLDLNDIEADIFPTLEGDVRVALLDPADGDVTFDAVDSDRLRVNLVCEGGDPVAAQQLRDREGGPEPDGYRYGPAFVQEHNLQGECELRVRAGAGFERAVVPLPRPLEPTDGESSPDQVVNVALVPPLGRCEDSPSDRLNQMCGYAYWVDLGAGDAAVPAGGIDVHTIGDVIIGFEPGTSQDEQPEPLSAGSPLQTSTGGDGNWTFVDPRQIFGETAYEFEHGDYASRTIEITVDEDGREVAPGEPDPGPALTDDDDDGIGVELDADGGAIRGTITVLTVKRPAAHDEFEMDLSGAGSYSPDFQAPSLIGIGWTATAVAQTENPGTYDATISPAEHHELVAGQPNDTGFRLGRQEPGQDMSISRAYVELGQVDVRVQDALGTELDDVEVTLTHDHQPFPPFPPGDPPGSSENATTDGGEVTFTDLAVNGPTPWETPTSYMLEIDRAGYDVDSASIIGITDHEGQPVPCAADLTVCQLPVFAGSELDVTIEVEQQGSITGNVVGDLGADEGTPGDSADREPLTLPDGLIVTATRVAGANGELLPTPGEPIRAVADGDGFSVSGPPGFYTIDAAHPFYQDLQIWNIPCPHPGPADSPYPPCSPETPIYPATGEPMFEMANITAGNEDPNDIDNPWVLFTEPSRIDLDVTAHTDDDDQTPIEGATVSIFDEEDSGSQVYEGVTGEEGRPTEPPIPPLLPERNYRVEIRKVDAAGDDEYFPVIVTINLPQGSSDDERTRSITAALPLVGGGLVGRIVAVNTEGDPVPAPNGITVGREFDPPDVEVAGPESSVLIPNEQTDVGSVTCSRPPSGDALCQPQAGQDGDTPASTGYEYRFTGLPVGVHQLSFSGDDAYDSPTPAAITAVADFGTPTPIDTDVEYVAADRTVEIDIATSPPLAADELTVTLRHSDGDSYGMSPAAPSGTCTPSCTFTVDDVPPELDPYTVEAEADLYEPATDDVLVVPGAGPHEHPEPLHLDASVARIGGTARRQSGPGPLDPVGPGDDGNPQLSLLRNGAEVASAPDGWNDDGTFDFIVDEVGDYQLRLELDDHVTQVSPNINIAALGGVVGQDITAKAVATVTIEVDGPPPPTGDLDVAIQPDALEATQTGRTFMFEVDPDLDYRFEVSASGYVTQPVPETGTRAVDPGETVELNVELVQRQITGTVSSGAETVDGVQVRATTGAVTLPETTTGDDGTFTFTGVDAGMWTITAEELGIGRGQVVDVEIAPTDGDQDVMIDLQPRDVGLSFSTDPDAATIELTDPDDDSQIMIGEVGDVDFVATEDRFPVDWTASLDDHEDESGTVDLPDLGDTFDESELGPIEISLIVLTETPPPTSSGPPPTSSP